MYIVKRIIIYLFFVVFYLLSFLYNIHSCCCFKFTKVETDKDKQERLRREKEAKENALKDKLFRIISKWNGNCQVYLNKSYVEIKDDVSLKIDNKDILCKKMLSIDENKNKELNNDVSVDADGDFIIKHYGDNIKVKFYYCAGVNFDTMYVHGENLSNKLGIRSNNPVTFYYKNDAKFLESDGRNNIIKEKDKPVPDFTINVFDCFKCIFIDKNWFYIEFYKVKNDIS